MHLWHCYVVFITRTPLIINYRNLIISLKSRKIAKKKKKKTLDRHPAWLTPSLISVVSSINKLPRFASCIQYPSCEHVYVLLCTSRIHIIIQITPVYAMIDGLFRDVFLAKAYRFVGRSLVRRYPHAFIRVY